MKILAIDLGKRRSVGCNYEADGTRIDVDDLPRHVVENRPPQGGSGEIESGSWRATPLREALEAPERGIILAAPEANGWNRQATAEALQINRTTLYKKIKRYGLAG
jgi:transcriptional regulator of acetoin/glycerol metabolism